MGVPWVVARGVAYGNRGKAYKSLASARKAADAAGTRDALESAIAARKASPSKYKHGVRVSVGRKAIKPRYSKGRRQK